MSRCQVIVLATGKGGAGKSTLARSLAGHWANLGRKTTIIDADPQASISSLHDAESAMGVVSVIEDAEEETIQGSIEEAQETSDIVIVDTAGFRNKTTVLAMLSADKVIIPLKAAAEDLREAVEMHDIVHELSQTPERKGIPIVACMVLTMTTRGTVISRQIRKELTGAGYNLLHAEMVHRVAYPEASSRGLTPTFVDPEGAAARDISKIANELNKLEGTRHDVKAA